MDASTQAKVASILKKLEVVQATCSTDALPIMEEAIQHLRLEHSQSTTLIQSLGDALCNLCSALKVVDDKIDLKLAIHNIQHLMITHIMAFQEEDGRDPSNIKEACAKIFSNEQQAKNLNSRLGNTYFQIFKRVEQPPDLQTSSMDISIDESLDTSNIVFSIVASLQGVLASCSATASSIIENTIKILQDPKLPITQSLGNALCVLCSIVDIVDVKVIVHDLQHLLITYLMTYLEKQGKDPSKIKEACFEIFRDRQKAKFLHIRLANTYFQIFKRGEKYEPSRRGAKKKTQSGLILQGETEIQAPEEYLSIGFRSHYTPPTFIDEQFTTTYTQAIQERIPLHL